MRKEDQNNYFFYDQIRRYHLQFNRIFSSLLWKTGRNKFGEEEFRSVPCVTAGGSLTVGAIQRDGMENKTNTYPMISTYLEDVRLVPERRQDPNYVRQITTSERALNEVNGHYTGSLGNQYTIESYMPVPYDIIMKVEVATSNTKQKHELMEQIMVLFNPAIDLQTSNNMFDWTSLGIVEMTNIGWSSNSLPTTEDIDITTVSFRVPIWLSPPSKIKRQTIIREIITNIGELKDMSSSWPEEGNYWNGNEIDRIVTTPGNFSIEVNGFSKNIFKIKLLNYNQKDLNDNQFTWRSLLEEYGQYFEDKSQLILLNGIEGLDENQMRAAGSFHIDKVDETLLVWNVNPDSLPPLTPRIPLIKDIIKSDTIIENPSVGDCYIVMDNIFQNGQVWGELFYEGVPIKDKIAAPTNSIVEWDGDGWNVLYHSELDITEEIWTYCESMENYYHCHGGKWIMTLDGEYPPGLWRLKL